MTFGMTHWKRSLSVALLVISVLYFVFIWLGYDEAWIHPEQIRAAVYIWTPNTDSYLQLLRKAFDWAALDTADPIYWQQQAPAQRVRPLSDVAQVIDAIARPTITRFLYPHPSFTPSAILAAIFAPLFFFRFLRLTFNNTTVALAFTALWLSSTGFLSIIIPDIHAAAKRLSILLLCLSLYLAARHERDNKQSTFWGLALALLLSLFADEMALGAYVALCCLFFPSFLREGTRWKALVIMGLPAIFVIATNWGLPALYAIASTDGTPAFVPIGDPKKLGLIAHLGHWEFYFFGLSQTARAILSTIGMSVQNETTEYVALTALIGGTAWLAWKSKGHAGDRHMAYGLVTSAIVVIANGIYLTLLDLYPPEIYPPGQYPAGATSYLGSYTYYYHSSLSVLSVLWLAYVCRAVMNLRWRNVRARSLLSTAGISLTIVAVVLNFRLFHNINQLVALTHLYPLQPAQLYKKIESTGAQVARITGNDVIPVEFNSNCTIVTEKFAQVFDEVMGDTWQTNPFNTYFAKFSFSPDDLEHLLNAHYPLNKFSVRISKDPSGCGEPRLFLSAPSGPPGQRLLLSVKGFKPHAEVNFFWGSAGGLLLGSVYTDASGNFTDFPVEIPYHSAATYNIFASTYTGLTSTSYTITTSPVAEASVTPNQAPPGRKIIVAGSGFMVATGYIIRWNAPDGLPLGTGATDIYGKVPPTTVLVPEVAAGNYQLYVTDDRNRTSLVPFTVASPSKE